MKRDAIHLDTLEQLASETTRIERLSADGCVHPLGNWSAAQVLKHLGLFVKGSLDGFPFRYPWHIRVVSHLVGRISWRMLMRLAFRPGFKNSGAARAVEPDPAVSLPDAADFLRHEIGRVLAGEKMNQESSTGERLSHEQWIECHLRHAELHLGFLAIEPPANDPRSAAE